jgi:hypothetical protein
LGIACTTVTCGAGGSVTVIAVTEATREDFDVPETAHVAAVPAPSTRTTSSPTRLDPEQEKLLRELAALRGEDQPESHREAQGGLFSRVRDVFK